MIKEILSNKDNEITKQEFIKIINLFPSLQNDDRIYIQQNINEILSHVYNDVITLHEHTPIINSINNKSYKLIKNINFVSLYKRYCTLTTYIKENLPEVFNYIRMILLMPCTSITEFSKICKECDHLLLVDYIGKNDDNDELLSLFLHTTLLFYKLEALHDYTNLYYKYSDYPKSITAHDDTRDIYALACIYKYLLSDEDTITTKDIHILANALYVLKKTLNIEIDGWLSDISRKYSKDIYDEITLSYKWNIDKNIPIHKCCEDILKPDSHKPYSKKDDIIIFGDKITDFDVNYDLLSSINNAKKHIPIKSYSTQLSILDLMQLHEYNLPIQKILYIDENNISVSLHITEYNGTIYILYKDLNNHNIIYGISIDNGDRYILSIKYKDIELDYEYDMF